MHNLVIARHHGWKNTTVNIVKAILTSNQKLFEHWPMGPSTLEATLYPRCMYLSIAYGAKNCRSEILVFLQVLDGIQGSGLLEIFPFLPEAVLGTSIHYSILCINHTIQIIVRISTFEIRRNVIPHRPAAHQDSCLAPHSMYCLNQIFFRIDDNNFGGPARVLSTFRIVQM